MIGVCRLRRRKSLPLMREVAEQSEVGGREQYITNKNRHPYRVPVLQFNFSVFFFKSFDFFSDQIQNLSVDAASFILRDILELVVQLAVNAQTEMFIFFLKYNSQSYHPNKFLKFSLSTLADKMFKMDLL